MGLLDSVRNGAVRTKLHAEIALLDRQLQQQKAAFGVEFYGKLTGGSSSGKGLGGNSGSSGGGGSIALPAALVPHHADEIRALLDECRRDVMAKENERNACEIEVEKIAARRERANPHRDTVAKAGSWMTDTGTDAKLRLRIQLLQRERHQRLEKFGVAVFDLVVTEAGSAAAAAVVARRGNAVSAGLGKLTGGLAGGATDKELADCLHAAARTAAVTRQQKESKVREIAQLQQ